MSSYTLVLITVAFLAIIEALPQNLVWPPQKEDEASNSMPSVVRIALL